MVDIQDIIALPKFQQLSKQKQQEVVGKYFDKRAPEHPKWGEVDDETKAKARSNYVKKYAEADTGDIAKASAQKFATGAAKTLSNTAQLALQAQDPYGMLAGMVNKATGTDTLPETASAQGYLADLSGKLSKTAGKLSDEATLETGIGGQIAQTGSDITGQIVGSLPAYGALGKVAEGVKIASPFLQNAARGAIQFGGGAAAAADPENRVRAGVSGAVVGPISYSAGNIPGQLLPRAATAASEAIGSVGEQLAFDGNVDPVQVAIQAGLGGVFGKNATEKAPAPERGIAGAIEGPPDRLALPEPQKQINDTAGVDTGFTMGGDADVAKAQKTLRKVQDKYRSGKATDKDIEDYRNAYRVIKDATERNRNAAAAQMAGKDFDADNISSDPRIANAAQADVEAEAASQGYRGPDVFSFEAFNKERPSVEGYLYHGSPDGDIVEVDTNYSTNTWREGIGFYVTDARNIAKMYAEGRTARGDRRGSATSSGKINYIKIDPSAKIIDMESPYDKELWDQLASLMSETGYDPTIDGSPFKAGTNGAAYQSLIREYALDNGVSATEAAYELKAAMEDIGIDGTTHIEGKQGDPHRVRVLFGSDWVDAKTGETGSDKKFKIISPSEAYNDYLKQKSSKTINPNNYRAQQRLSPEDVNESVIDQPNIPGDGDPRIIGIVPSMVSNVEYGDIDRGWAYMMASTTDWMRSQGSDVAGRMADLGESAISESQKVGGRYRPILNKLRHHLWGEGKWAPRNVLKIGKIGVARGIDTLHRKIEAYSDGNGTAHEMSFDRIGNGLDPETNLNAFERKTIEIIRELHDERSKVNEEYGRVRQGQDGTIEPWKHVEGEKIFARVPTAEHHAILMSPVDSKVRKFYIKALAEMNGRTEEEVNRILSSHIETMTGQGPGRDFGTTQMDFHREFQRVPFIIDVDGKSYRLYETDILRYAQSLANSHAQVMGAHKSFGQEIGDTKPLSGMKLSDLKKEFIASHPGQGAKFNTFMRSLNGMPIDGEIGNNIAKMQASIPARFVNGSMQIIKALMLTPTAPLNLLESGSSSRTLYPKAHNEALKGLAKSLKNPAEMKRILAELEVYGLTTHDAFVPYLSPDRPIQDLARVTADVISRLSVVKFANDVNSVIAGLTSLNQSKMWQRGEFHPRDIDTLVSLGYTKPLAERIVNGRATQARYDEVARRISRKIPGGAASNAEKSLLEQSRAFKSASWFHTYAMSLMRQNMRAASRGRKLLEQFWNEPDPRKSMKLGARFLSDLLRGAGLRIGVGAGTALIMSATMDGPEGLKQTIFDAKSNLKKFIIENLINQSVAGPVGRMSMNLFQGRTSSIADMFVPVGAATEVYEMLSGTGRYSDSLNAGDAFVDFLKRMTGGHKIAKNMLGATGLTMFFSDEKMEADRRAYWDFKRDNGLLGATGGSRKDQEQWQRDNRKFVSNMKAAIEALDKDQDIYKHREDIIRAILDGDSAQAPLQAWINTFMNGEGSVKDAREFIVNAIKSDPDRMLGGDAIKASLNGRKMLDKASLLGNNQATDGQYLEYLNALKNRIGDEAYHRLELHDAMMDVWADSWVAFTSKELGGSDIGNSIGQAAQQEQARNQALAVGHP